MDRKRIAGLVRNGLTAFVFAALAAAPARAEDDITGEWEVKMDRNGRESFATLTISKKADGALAGKWGSADLAELKFAGGKLSFVRTVRFGDQEFSTSYEGTLKDGAFAGTLSSDRGSFAANAARRKPRSPILGRWNFKYAVGDRAINATLAVSEKAGGGLDGKWTSDFGEHVVTAIKFEGGKLALARKSKLEDRELETTYEGKLEGDNKLAGTIKSEFGEIPAGAERVGAALVGKWELTSSSERGPRTRILTVYGDLSGRYESFGGELPIKSLKLDGDQVAFSVEMDFGDQPTTIEFKGKLDGKTIKGETTSQRGTREITGKKLEPAPAAAPKTTL